MQRLFDGRNVEVFFAPSFLFLQTLEIYVKSIRRKSSYLQMCEKGPNCQIRRHGIPSYKHVNNFQFPMGFEVIFTKAIRFINYCIHEDLILATEGAGEGVTTGKNRSMFMRNKIISTIKLLQKKGLAGQGGKLYCSTTNWPTTSLHRRTIRAA